jgi:hypothetical protein
VEPNKNKKLQAVRDPNLVPIIFGSISVVIILLDRVLR